MLEKFSSVVNPCSITNDIADEKKAELKMLKICSWIIFNSIRYTKDSLYLNKRKKKIFFNNQKLLIQFWVSFLNVNGQIMRIKHQHFS
jgi:hypothetical protein